MSRISPILLRLDRRIKQETVAAELADQNKRDAEEVARKAWERVETLQWLKGDLTAPATQKRAHRSDVGKPRQKKSRVGSVSAPVLADPSGHAPGSNGADDPASNSVAGGARDSETWETLTRPAFLDREKASA